MKVNCQSCGAQYAIADDKVRGRKVKVRCKSCTATIVVDGASLVGSPEGAAGLGVEQKTLDGSALSPFASSQELWSVSVSDDDQRELTREQILEAMSRGEFGEGVYLWKEGMADWQPLEGVAEFKQALGPPADLAPFPAPAAVAASPAAAPPAAPAPFPAPAAVVPRVAAAPRAAAVPRASAPKDLFSPRSLEDDEGEALAPTPALGATGSAGHTGLRNESSVLFSLDALKRQSTAPPPAPAKAHKPTDAFTLGFGSGGLGGMGGGGGLFAPDAQALLTAPAAPEPPVAIAAAPGLPAFDVVPPKKSPRWLLPTAGVALVGVAALAFFTLRGGSAEPAASNPTAEAAVSAQDARAFEEEKQKAEEEAQRAEAERAALEKAEAEKKAEEARKAEAEKAEAEKKAEESKAASSKGSQAVGGSAKAPPKAAAVEAPSGGGPQFDVGAAKAALGAAAAEAAGCKGDAGSGRATVTFGPSGSVTSVSISGVSGFQSNCASGAFKKARVPAFSGAPVTVARSFKISG
jgi:predicted Zn finger-like uncharacterized protein